MAGIAQSIFQPFEILWTDILMSINYKRYVWESRQKKKSKLFPSFLLVSFQFSEDEIEEKFNF